MLPNTDETTVDTVTLAPSKQSIETTEVKSTTQSEPGKPPVEVEEIHTEEASAGKAQPKDMLQSKQRIPIHFCSIPMNLIVAPSPLCIRVSAIGRLL